MTSSHFHQIDIDFIMLDPAYGVGKRRPRAAEITRGECAFPRMAVTETVMY